MQSHPLIPVLYNYADNSIKELQSHPLIPVLYNYAANSIKELPLFS